MTEHEESNVEECMICSMPLCEQYCHKLECGHTFHYECLLTSAIINRRHSSSHNSCPYCRTKHGYLPIINGLTKTKIKPVEKFPIERNVTVTAMTIPTIPKKFPCLEVSGEDKPRRASIKSTPEIK